MWCQELSEPGNSDRFCMEHGVTYEILITNYAMQKFMWLALALMAEGLWKKWTNVLWYKHTLCWAHFTALMVRFKRSTHLRELDKNSHIEAIKCTLGINYGHNFIANALTITSSSGKAFKFTELWTLFFKQHPEAALPSRSFDFVSEKWNDRLLTRWPANKYNKSQDG